MKISSLTLFCAVLLAVFPRISLSADKFRVIWNADPATQAVVGWCGPAGAEASIHYGYEDFGADWEMYPSKENVGRSTDYLKLSHHFARLQGLKADSKVFFVVRDSAGVSSRFWFRTAPSENKPFTFVAGGDSRNHRDARQRANRTVAALRPLFVCFGGDMIDKPQPQSWSDWLDDWQLTSGKDGRMIPIVAARGNHESSKCIHSIFDTPQKDDYYAFSIGQKYFRAYTLNSNITRAGKQGDWLKSDLARHADTQWKLAQYHHPFRPHTSGKKEQFQQYNAWAKAFYQFGLTMAVECDSHTVKRTWPVRPSEEPGSDEGFIRDDKFGTVFVGEGCWGAPIRKNDDDKNWTRDSGKFNQVNWVSVTPDRILCRTVMVDKVDEFGMVDDSAPARAPDGLVLWEPKSGAEMLILPRGSDQISPVITARATIVLGKVIHGESEVRLTQDGEGGRKGSVIRYTTDQSTPTSDSALFGEPFNVAVETEIKAALFHNGQIVSAVASARVPKPKPKPKKEEKPKPKKEATDKSADGGASRLNIVFFLSYPVAMRSAGYRTGFVGKFGVGAAKGETQRMFDVFKPLNRNPYFKKWEGVRGSRYVYARYFGQQPAFEFLHDLEEDAHQLKNLAQSPGSQDALKSMRTRCDDLKASYVALAK